jgi:glutamyl-tRNA reductase
MTRIINAKVTFHRAPIHVLERFTFKDPQTALWHFREHSGLDECVILQTCNRVELFASAGMCDPEKIKRTWASLAGLDEDAFRENLEILEGESVYHHLLRLASGLDSMVVGEEQILGQIKGSITAARNLRMSGRHLNTLFDKTVRIGTRIRNSTGIGQGGVSVGSMAVKLAEANMADLKSKRILLIGTGEASTLAAKSLARRGYSFDVASRTLSRARAFCETMGGEPIRYQDVLERFKNYDAVFVATSAPYFLVTFEHIRQAMRAKPQGIMILDLSNPRTVDERVAMLGGVKLMNLDQIAEMVDKNMRSRLNKVKMVEDIITQETAAIGASMRRLDAEPIIKSVFSSADERRRKELKKALQMLGEQDQSRIKIIEDLTKAVVEGIVSAPMNNLRKASERGDEGVLDAASSLFGYRTD